MEREPITEANVDEALSGPEISEAEHEVVLHEGEPVVEKRAVPKERVRLEKDTVTDEREVSEEVRKADRARRRDAALIACKPAAGPRRRWLPQSPIRGGCCT